jgi:hypothetical protein
MPVLALLEAMGRLQLTGYHLSMDPEFSVN